ncbi:hypothetical protein P7K49_020112 [Saguinus oedipus]|uniref:Uncharacterized protein n=1 Tax=Saguinus oedipus TaxID=9490 RepID=A0ABQ9V012_SAGOE|nr:hypothetical protein P7K49_020112 [Saguinus oedipus]
MAAGAGVKPAPRWLRALGEPLSAAQLRRLEEHRYSAAGVSLLEPPLQLYWTWLLQWIPLWMAPNSITLLGLAVNMLTTLVLISYCPTATEEPGPRCAAGGALEALGRGQSHARLSLSRAREGQTGHCPTVTPLSQSRDYFEPPPGSGGVVNVTTPVLSPRRGWRAPAHSQPHAAPTCGMNLRSGALHTGD